MRWRKASMRTLNAIDRRGRNSLKEEEDEINFISSEKKARKLYEMKKDSFEKSREKKYHKNRDGEERFFFSPTTGIFPVLKEKNKTNLGIPTVDYIYHGPPFYFHKSSDDKEEEFVYKIIRSKNKPIQENTLSYKIFQILLKAKSSLHINNIILSLKDGLNPTNHIYSVVYRTLTRNNDLFLRSGKATFSLRKGFLSWAKPAKIARELSKVEELASFQQLVIEATKLLSPTGFSSPSDVFQFLINAGYNGTYDSVYSAMQSSNFERDGTNYCLTAKR